MKIELKQPYQSITTLTTTDLPDFALLIGRNGAGKTQLLRALTQGAAGIHGTGLDEIELYDMGSFRSPNVNTANHQVGHFAQITADAYLYSPSGQPPIEVAASVFAAFVSDLESDSGVEARQEFERNLRREIRRLANFTVFAAGDQGSPYKETLYEQVLAPINRASTGRQDRRDLVVLLPRPGRITTARGPILWPSCGHVRWDWVRREGTGWDVPAPK